MTMNKSLSDVNHSLNNTSKTNFLKESQGGRLDKLDGVVDTANENKTLKLMDNLYKKLNEKDRKLREMRKTAFSKINF